MPLSISLSHDASPLYLNRRKKRQNLTKKSQARIFMLGTKPPGTLSILGGIHFPPAYRQAGAKKKAKSHKKNNPKHKFLRSVIQRGQLLRFFATVTPLPLLFFCSYYLLFPCVSLFWLYFQAKKPKK